MREGRSEERREQRRWLPPALILLTVAIRLATIVVAPANEAEFPVRIDYWAEIAHQLAQGRGFSLGGATDPEPTASRVPLYPLTLSLVYRLTGGSDRAGLVFQGLLDGCTAWLLMRLGRRIGRAREGLFAALGWALYVPQWRMSQRLWAEPFYTVVGVLLLLAVAAAERQPSRRKLLVVGVLAGALTLSRPIGLLALPIVAAWLASRSKPARRHLALILLGFGVTMLPWVARNTVQMNAFVPLDTTGGFNLYVGTFGAQYYVPMSQFDPEVLARLEGRSTTETDRILRDAAVRRILADPMGHVRRMGRKLTAFFFGFRDPDRDRVPTLETLAVGLLLYPLALVGWWRLRRAGVAMADLLLALPVGIALAHAQIVSQMRMMLPVLPCLLLLAGAGVAGLVGRAGAARQR